MRTVLIAIACISAPAFAADFPEFAGEPLKRGRAVWLGTCEACHANPDSDAPQVRDAGAWRPRVAKGREALYASALGGFKGPSGTEMPARGGNKGLSDAEVRAAVDYMVRIAVPANPPPKEKS